MTVLLEILKNGVMGIPSIAKLAERRHHTGLNADAVMARRVFELYSRFTPAAGKDILEIGPGQTLEVLEEALKSGAKSCTAADVSGYLTAEEAARRGIEYRVYDGRGLPFVTGRFDCIWSHTAFEHLRYPEITVNECFRVLRPGGSMVAHIDLADHSYYGCQPPQPLRAFECLRYPSWLWTLMKWNRSSYVNRLRKSGWMRLFEKAGFVVGAECSRISEEIERALPALPYLHAYSHEDAVTAVLTVRLDKPV
ncbi:MAG TPA: class I SAM-dependent methyltransferase [Nitrospira sp.]|nr:class I SAM-dependent methyltransferase [Nitrospira sp.]